MTRFLIKAAVSGLLIATAAEAAQRSRWLGAVIIALPLNSILMFVWLYAANRDGEQVASMSVAVFWAVLPTLLFLAVLPAILRRGVPFGWAMAASSALMAAGFLGYRIVLARLGVRL